jgi:hypothetical protein
MGNWREIGVMRPVFLLRLAAVAEDDFTFILLRFCTFDAVCKYNAAINNCATEQ